MKTFLSFLAFAGLAILSACSSEPANVQEFQELVQKLDAKNNQIVSVNQEIRQLVREYNTQVPPSQRVALTGVDSLGFSEKQQQVLSELLQMEENVSYRGLLQQIVDKNAEVWDLAGQVAELRDKLPVPRRVKGGDTHFDLVMLYLKNEKSLDEKTARDLAEKTMLIDELVPGFDVWMYYNDGTFGTFVTQGTAPVSPNKYKYSIRREQIARETQKVLQQYKDSLVQATTDTLKTQGVVTP